MISIKKILAVAGLACIAVAIMVSCKKETKISYTQPVITRVAQPLDSTGIVSGSFTQWIIIYGEHLSSTESVTFNDQVVDYKNFYASDTSISVQIPRAIPENVTNTITVTTKGGTATYQFTVLIPDLQLAGILNEYTAVGDTLTLVGQNFDLYGFTKEGTIVTFTGGQTANLTDASPSALKLIVPEGAGEGPISIKGTAPLNTEATTPDWYKDSRNMLFSMDPFTGWNGSAFISSGPDPAPVNGPYFKVNKSWQGGWAWDPFCSNNCNIPQELVNDPAQYVHYAIKFEMNTPAGPPSLPLKLYMCFNSGNFREYFYDPSGSGTFPFTTNGKWQTFTVPLKNWGNLDGFTFSSTMIMEFMLKDANPSESNFAICNFRMVPLN